MVGCLLVDLLPDIGGHGAPVLQLRFVQLVDAEVRLRVLLLPPDRVEEGAELRQSIDLDRCHLLMAVNEVIRHLINMRGLLLVVPQVYDPSPP